jgi:tetratricopeptide (TPR) repeat protein
VYCGLLVSLGRPNPPDRTSDLRVTVPDQLSHPRWTRRSGSVGVAAVLVLVIVVLAQANTARLAEQEWDLAMEAADEFSAREAVGTNEQYSRLLIHAEKAAGLQPHNITYAYNLNLHRWRSISRLVDEQGQQLISESARTQYTPRIVAELHRARPLCPTFGSLYSLVGQLELFILNEPAGAAHIRTGYRLSATDANACFVAGELALREGAWQESVIAMRRAIKLDSGLGPTVTNLYLRAARPMLAVAVVEHDPYTLLALAQKIESEDGKAATTTSTARNVPPTTMMSESTSQAARVARERAESLLQAECARDDASPHALGTMAGILRNRGQYSPAIQYYRRALRAEYRAAELRLELAKTLARAGDIEAAIKETEIFLRQRPGMLEANQLLERLKAEIEKKNQPSSNNEG